MADFPVTIFHNPNCGTSRAVLQMIRDAGHSPSVIEYLDAGWSEQTLREILRDTGLAPDELLRAKSDLAAELDLLTPGVPDDDILAAMIEHPVLVERPVVRTPKGAVLARPAEKVLDIL